MSLTQEERELLQIASIKLSFTEQAIVEAIFVELGMLAATGDVRISYDDRAAKLEAALVRYLIDSRED